MPAFFEFKTVRTLFAGIVLFVSIPVLTAWATEFDARQDALHQPKVSFAAISSRPNSEAEPVLSVANAVDAAEARPQQLLNVAKAFDSSAQFMVASSSQKQRPDIQQASFNKTENDPEEKTVSSEKAPVLELPPKQPEKIQKKPASTDLESETAVPENDTEAGETENSIGSKKKDDSLLDQSLVFSKDKAGKGNKLERPRLSNSIAPLVSVIGSLLIVLATFFILAILFKKFSPKNGRQLPREAFEDLGRAFIAQKTNMHLLRLGNRLILVCITADGVSPITEVTDPDEVVAILGLCRRLDENSSSELFRQTLSKIIDKESKDDDYFGAEIQQKKPTRNKPAPKNSSSAGTSTLDLYSDSNESLTDLLASGLTAKGVRHG